MEPKKQRVTTVITSFNRRHCIANAIESALGEFPWNEIVIVDDASTDGTSEFIKSRYSAEIEESKLKLVCLQENIGVSGAKNIGYTNSSGEWVVFLDSDDYFEKGVATHIVNELQLSSESPIVFFRCRTQAGDFVGEREGERLKLNLKTYLRYTSFGESLTAINKRLIKSSVPYVQTLRGYEGIGCARLIRDFGPAVLSNVVARIYVISGGDRLSTRQGFLSRLPLLAKGHFMMLREFSPQMSRLKNLALFFKAFIYFVVGYSYFAIRKIAW
jgi:glycosyltransferase involved in cell wall biosynthesis